MVNVCVLHLNENKTGKNPFSIVIWTTYFHLLFASASERASVRARYSINNWLNFSAYYWTHGCACIRASTQGNVMCTHTIWNVDIFLSFYEYVFPLSITQFMNLTRTRCMCVCVCYVRMGFVCHTNALTRVFLFARSLACLFVCLFVCLVCSVFGRLFYVRAVMRDNLPPLLLHHKTKSMSENCKHSKVKWREQHHKTITIQYST